MIKDKNRYVRKKKGKCSHGQQLSLKNKRETDVCRRAIFIVVIIIKAYYYYCK